MVGLWIDKKGSVRIGGEPWSDRGLSNQESVREGGEPGWGRAGRGVYWREGSRGGTVQPGERESGSGEEGVGCEGHLLSRG